MGTKKLAPTKSQPTVKSDKTNQPINMTGSASDGSIGDKISFSSQKTNNKGASFDAPNNFFMKFSNQKLDKIKISFKGSSL